MSISRAAASESVEHRPLELELTWAGKYDEAGHIASPDVEALQAGARWQCHERYGAALPGTGESPASRLYAGDNLTVLANLLPEYEGQLALIYLDPPFFAEADFRGKIPVGCDPDEPRKPRTTIEALAYRDTWPRGIGEYLRFLHQRLVLMHRLLKESGSLFLHCDYRVAAYVRLLLDEVFAPQGRLVNEICWYYKRWSAATRHFQRMHDTIFFYAKTEAYRFRPLYQPLASSTEAMHGTTIRVNVPDETGKLVTKRTEVPSKGVLMHDVWEIPFVVAHSQEQVGYPTQKPVELLARILEATTEPGELVADFFAGAGALPAAAEGLRVRREGPRAVYAREAQPRRWLAADASALAVHTMRKRLLGLPASSDGPCEGNGPHFELWRDTACEAEQAGTVTTVQSRRADGSLVVRLCAFTPALATLEIRKRDRARLEEVLRADPSGLSLLDAWSLGRRTSEGSFVALRHVQRPRRGVRELFTELVLPPHEAIAPEELVVQAVDCFGRVAEPASPSYSGK